LQFSNEGGLRVKPGGQRYRRGDGRANEGYEGFIEGEGPPRGLYVINVGGNGTVDEFDTEHIREGTTESIAEMIRVGVVEKISVTAIDYNGRVAN
jgi:hypothetical protein